MTYDTIIKRGQIADGTGSPLFTADIALIGDRIAAVGDIEGDAQTTIDARGLIVSPGLSTLTPTLTPNCSGTAQLNPRLNMA